MLNLNLCILIWLQYYKLCVHLIFKHYDIKTSLTRKSFGDDICFNTELNFYENKHLYVKLSNYLGNNSKEFWNIKFSWNRLFSTKDKKYQKHENNWKKKFDLCHLNRFDACRLVFMVTVKIHTSLLQCRKQIERTWREKTSK